MPLPPERFEALDEAAIDAARSCPLCAEPLRGPDAVACRACHAGFHRACLGASRACPTSGCANAGPVPLFDVPAAPRPGWLGAVCVAAFLPLLATGGNPIVGLLLGEAIHRLAPEIPRWLAFVMGTGFVVLPTLVGCALLVHGHVAYRAVRLDEAGLLLGHTDRWRGRRVPWADVETFSIATDGLDVRLRGRPWARWLGLPLRCEERVVHDIVAALEARGIPRADSE